MVFATRSEWVTLSPIAVVLWSNVFVFQGKSWVKFVWTTVNSNVMFKNGLDEIV